MISRHTKAESVDTKYSSAMNHCQYAYKPEAELHRAY